MENQYLTVSEIADKYGISRARVFQLLDEKDWRKECIEKKAQHRASILLIPERLFAGYSPVPVRQQAGKVPKSLKKKKK